MRRAVFEIVVVGLVVVAIALLLTLTARSRSRELSRRGAEPVSPPAVPPQGA
jgi:predicted metal-binding membrane protein